MQQTQFTQFNQIHGAFESFPNWWIWCLPWSQSRTPPPAGLWCTLPPLSNIHLQDTYNMPCPRFSMLKSFVLKKKLSTASEQKNNAAHSALVCPLLRSFFLALSFTTTYAWHVGEWVVAGFLQYYMYLPSLLSTALLKKAAVKSGRSWNMRVIFILGLTWPPSILS